MSSTPASTLATLDAAECRVMLRRHPLHVGRIGFVIRGRPLVLPVNYRWHDDAIIIRVAEQSVLLEAAGAPVAFEVDEVDESWREGWSVLVQGWAWVVDDPDEVDRLARLPLRPWVQRDPAVYLRITADEVSGRRIV